VAVEILPHGEGLPLPVRATENSAGLDLRAAIEASLILEPGARIMVPTGLKMAIPPGFEGQVRPRSGLAFRHGVTVVNAPGTIDADYRGEVCVLLINLGQEPFTLERGERIAQLVVAPVSATTLVPVDSLDATARGEGGFGSSGVK
jgi:dUTP pyrophosphatase